MNMTMQSLATPNMLLVLKKHFFGCLLLASLLTMVGCSTTRPVETSANTASPTVAKPQLPQPQVAIPPVTLQAPPPTTTQTLPQTAIQIRRANFLHASASAETKRMADWVVDSGDHENRNFVIIDKKDARVFVFNANGVLRGDAPVLLGMTVGDASFPGIGDKPLKSIQPHEKTTPPGRFLSSIDKNINGKDIIWIDYDGAVSLHAIVKGTPVERRAERLSSPTPSDNRISYGCINAPVDFFRSVVIPTFRGSDGIVYILPDELAINQVFAAWYDVTTKEVNKLAAEASDPIAQFGALKLTATTNR